MIFTLACINGMESVARDLDSQSLAATDFGPAGVAAGAIVLLLLPRPRPVERTLVLALWAVIAVLLGTALGFRVALSPGGLATIPLVVVVSALFHRRALARGRALAAEPSLRRAPPRSKPSAAESPTTRKPERSARGTSAREETLEPAHQLQKA